jgi:hypothetical protein
MKALHDIEQCRRRLSSILQMGMWDNTFDDTRHRMQMDLDNFCDTLTHAVTFNDWWSLLESKIKAQREAQQTRRPVAGNR